MDAEAEPGRLIDQDAFFNMSQSTRNAPIGLWFCADGWIHRPWCERIRRILPTAAGLW